MNVITLTPAQRDAIIAELDEIENGHYNIEVEFDEHLTVYAEGWFENGGYCEDDYFNGTGAWVETYRQGSIELKAIVTDDEGDQEECTIDEKSENILTDYLNTVQ